MDVHDGWEKPRLGGKQLGRLASISRRIYLQALCYTGAEEARKREAILDNQICF